jgi:hypothetical protein
MKKMSKKDIKNQRLTLSTFSSGRVAWIKKTRGKKCPLEKKIVSLFAIEISVDHRESTEQKCVPLKKIEA